jgi:hypothetical protein
MHGNIQPTKHGPDRLPGHHHHHHTPGDVQGHGKHPKKHSLPGDMPGHTAPADVGWSGTLDAEQLKVYYDALSILDGYQSLYKITDDAIATTQGTGYEELNQKWHGLASQARHNLQRLLTAVHAGEDIGDILTTKHVNDLKFMFDPSSANMSYIVTHTPNHQIMSLPEPLLPGDVIQIPHGKMFEASHFPEWFDVGEKHMWMPEAWVVQTAVKLFDDLRKKRILVMRDIASAKAMWILKDDDVGKQWDQFTTFISKYPDKALYVCTTGSSGVNTEFDAMIEQTADVVTNIPLLEKLAARKNYNIGVYLQCHPMIVHAFDPKHLIASALPTDLGRKNIDAFLRLPIDNWSKLLARCKIASAHSLLLHCVHENKINEQKVP